MEPPNKLSDPSLEPIEYMGVRNHVKIAMVFAATVRESLLSKIWNGYNILHLSCNVPSIAQTKPSELLEHSNVLEITLFLLLLLLLSFLLFFFFCCYCCSLMAFALYSKI